jgi:hypothetical protein
MCKILHRINICLDGGHILLLILSFSLLLWIVKRIRYLAIDELPSNLVFLLICKDFYDWLFLHKCYKTETPIFITSLIPNKDDVSCLSKLMQECSHFLHCNVQRKTSYKDLIGWKICKRRIKISLRLAIQGRIRDTTRYTCRWRWGTYKWFIVCLSWCQVVISRQYV